MLATGGRDQERSPTVGLYSRFVVVQFIARPAGCLLACTPPATMFCVETGNKLPYYEPLGVQLRKFQTLLEFSLNAYCAGLIPPQVSESFPSGLTANPSVAVAFCFISRSFRARL